MSKSAPGRRVFRIPETDFLPYDLGRCPNIVAYLARIGRRPAYRRAMELEYSVFAANL